MSELFKLLICVLISNYTSYVCQKRDKLVRKGILTPFHKLKGFERRLQRPGPSSGDNLSEEEDKTDDLASASIARAVRSISQSAQARPTTKLLDSETLPKFDAPTHPFQKLKKPLKFPHPLESETQKNTDNRRKKKRPLPGKKWRRIISREDEHLEESGMLNFLEMIFDNLEMLCICKINSSLSSWLRGHKKSLFM